MMGLSETNNSILLQNDHVQIFISKQDASVQQVIDLVTSKDIRGEQTCFFVLARADGSLIVPTGVTLADNIITVATPAGEFSVQVDADEDYFAFTLVTPLPADAYKSRAYPGLHRQGDRRVKESGCAANCSTPVMHIGKPHSAEYHRNLP